MKTTSHNRLRWSQVLLLAGICLLAACSNEDNPTPGPNEPDTYTLRLKSSQRTAFEEYTAGNPSGKELNADEADYFGTRTKRACPQELQFEGDSLRMVKGSGLVERYRFKQEGSRLLLHNPRTDQWEYCGEKEENKSVELNIGFYLRRDEKAASAVAGQEYRLTDPAALLQDAAEGTTLVWLRTKHTFE